MNKNIIISVDAMGGDEGPETVLAGVHRASYNHPDIEFLLFGQEDILTPILAKHSYLKDKCTIRHCDVAIGMDEKPSQALRQGRRVSSMWNAIDAVKQGEAHAAISAGNTGALMAMAKVILRMIDGIERPAIAAVWPTLHGESIVLDLGANINCSAAQFAQLSVMGAAYARILFGLETPRIGLLNIGVEEVKGTDNVKGAAEILANSNMNFIGFVEGDGISSGAADVIVTDGFTGNIALKTAEGTARQFGTFLQQAITNSFWAKIGYLFMRGTFAAVRERIDPNSFNGGMFLGLNGIVVKSHGGANAQGYGFAVEVAIDVAKANMATVMKHDIEAMQSLLDDKWIESLK